MNEAEAKELQDRLNKFKAADQKIERLAKIERLLAAVVCGEEHELGCVVIDVVAKQIRWIRVKGNEQYRICSLSDSEQSALVADYLSYATVRVSEMISQAELERANA